MKICIHRESVQIQSHIKRLALRDVVVILQYDLEFALNLDEYKFVTQAIKIQAREI